MKKLTIVSVCGIGVCSSLFLKMTIDNMLAEEGIEADTQPHDITSLSGMRADIVFTSGELKERVRGIMSCPTVAIDNFMDVDEIKAKGLGLIRELIQK